MKAISVIFVCLCGFCILDEIRATVEMYVFQFEDVQTKESRREVYRVMPRYKANFKETLFVRRFDGEVVIILDLCLTEMDAKYGPRNITVAIENIRYSNDGSDDRILLELDGEYIGEFTTVLRFQDGKGWNLFHNSHQIGHPTIVQPGTHQLAIKIYTDLYGVELDNIGIRVENNNRTQELFCGSRIIVD